MALVAAPVATEFWNNIDMVWTNIEDGLGLKFESLEQDDDVVSFQFTPQERVFKQCLEERVADEVGGMSTRTSFVTKTGHIDERKENRKIAKQIAGNAKKIAEALEAAFDDEWEQLMEMLREIPVDTCDIHGNSLLSEAAAGGADLCVQVLLARGANPNTLGRYRRSPLWRAAFAGHSKVVGVLLGGGADPRLVGQDAQRPFDVASNPDSRMLLECWDIRVTIKLKHQRRNSLPSNEREKEEREEKQRNQLELALHEVQRKGCIAKELVTEKQRAILDFLHHPIESLEQEEATRASTLHLMKSEFQLTSQLYQGLQWEEKRIRLKKQDFEERLQRDRERLYWLAALQCKAQALVQVGAEDVAVDITIPLQELINVVLLDIHGTRREDGRWPMVCDPSGKVGTFFNHSGYVVFTPLQLRQLMFSERIEDRQMLQVALLKQMSRGGSVVIDLCSDLSSMNFVEEAFNAIEPELFNILLDRSVLYSYILPKRFLSWAKKLSIDDLPESYSTENLRKFVLTFIVSTHPEIDPENNVIESTTQGCSDDGWTLIDGGQLSENVSAFYTVRVADGTCNP